MTEEMFDASPELTRSERKKRRRDEQRKAEARIPPLTAKTPNQLALLDCLSSYPVVFAVGPAGTGKTYIPSRIAVQRLLDKSVERIIIARPTSAPSRHRLGFQPGGINAKMKPWLVPVFDALRQAQSSNSIDKLLQDGRLEIVPFEHMRGRTFRDAFVIIDEAQNCTFDDLTMVLTRIGENCSLAICGDAEQNDLEEGESGLMAFVNIARRQHLNAGIVEFDDRDVVRSPVAAEWVRALRLYKLPAPAHLRATMR